MTIAPDRARSRSDEQMLTELDAARLLGVSPGTLRRYRYEGHGPVAHVYPSRTVRYARSDVLAWRARARTR